MTVQVAGNLLVRLALKVGHQHLPFKVAQYLAYLAFYVYKLLPAYYQFLRGGYTGPGKYVQKRSVGFLVIKRLIKGYV